MLKNILNLKGAQQLSKNEQSSINGGGNKWTCSSWIVACGPGYKCQDTVNGPICIPL